MTDLAATIAALLLELEATGDVAGALRTLGLRGHRMNCCMCPVRKYLAMHLPDVQIYDVRLYVSPSRGVFFYDTRTSEGEWVALPPRVATFAVDFDAGKHPDLEAA